MDGKDVEIGVARKWKWNIEDEERGLCEFCGMPDDHFILKDRARREAE